MLICAVSLCNTPVRPTYCWCHRACLDRPAASLGATAALAGVSVGSLVAVGEVFPSSGDRVAETADQASEAVSGR